MVEKRFDIDKFRYYQLNQLDANTFEKVYAQEQGKNVVEQFNNNTAIKQNNDFDSQFEIQKQIDDLPF